MTTRNDTDQFSQTMFRIPFGKLAAYYEFDFAFALGMSEQESVAIGQSRSFFPIVFTPAKPLDACGSNGVEKNFNSMFTANETPFQHGK